MVGNEKMVADKIYTGDSHFICPLKLPHFNKRYNSAIHKVRQNIERVNRRLKIWYCLKNQWRHSLEKHFIVFGVVCKLTNLLLKNDNL
jgi:hypothetical protein